MNMLKNKAQYLGSLSLLCVLSFSALHGMQDNVPSLADQVYAVVLRKLGEQIEQRVHGVDLKSIRSEYALDCIQKIDDQVIGQIFQPAPPQELESRIMDELCQTNPTIRFLLYPVSNDFVRCVEQQSKDVTSNTLDATAAQIERDLLATVPGQFIPILKREYQKRVWRKIYSKYVFFNSIAFAPDSRSCAYSRIGVDGIHLMELPLCKKIKTLPCESNQDVTFLPDGRVISQADYRDPICVWNGDKWAEELNGKVHKWFNYPRAFCDGKFYGHNCIWDAQSNQYTEISVNPGKHNTISDDGTLFAFEDPENFIYYRANNQQIHLYDVKKEKVINILKGHTNHIQGLAFVPKTKQLVSWSLDKTMQVWDTQTGKCTHVLQHDDGVREVAVARNGQLCISATKELEYKDIWDPITWQYLARVKSDDILAISHDGTYIAGWGGIYAAQPWKDTLLQAAIEKAETKEELEKICASKTMQNNNSVFAPRVASDLQEKLLALQQKK